MHVSMPNGLHQNGKENKSHRIRMGQKKKKVHKPRPGSEDGEGRRAFPRHPQRELPKDSRGKPKAPSDEHFPYRGETKTGHSALAIWRLIHKSNISLAPRTSAARSERDGQAPRHRLPAYHERQKQSSPFHRTKPNTGRACKGNGTSMGQIAPTKLIDASIIYINVNIN